MPTMTKQVQVVVSEEERIAADCKFDDPGDACACVAHALTKIINTHLDADFRRAVGEIPSTAALPQEIADKLQAVVKIAAANATPFRVAAPGQDSQPS